MARWVKSERVWLAGVLLFTALIFGRLGAADFTNWDDQTTIVDNPFLHTPLLRGLEQIWTRPQGHLYVPVTYCIWWITAAITGGASPSGGHWFHGLNILIHLWTVAIVFLILKLLVRRNLPAALGAVLFAIHPVQVEPVGWCSGTKDLLAGALGLSAIFLLIRGIGRDHFHKFALLGAATGLFAMALLAKPSAVIFPLLAMVLLIWLRRPRRDFVLPAIWLVMDIPIVIVGRLAQPVGPLRFVVPFYARPMIAGQAICFYLQKLFYPWSLAPDYGQSPAYILTQPATFWMVCVTIVLVGIIYLWRRQLPALALAGIIFIIALLPVLGLASFDFQHYSTTADHYLYVAMLGPAIVAAMWSRTRTGQTVIIAAIFCLSILTIRQCGFWNNSATLFTHNLRVNQRSGMSHVNLAIALADRGEWSGAYAQYRAALQLDFANPRAQFGVGQILAMAHQPNRALPHLQAAARLESESALTHYELAVLLAQMMRDDRAIDEYEKALTLNPGFVQAQVNLGTLFLARGDLEKAKSHYEAALEIDPGLERAQKGLAEISAQEQRINP